MLPTTYCCIYYSFIEGHFWGTESSRFSISKEFSFVYQTYIRNAQVKVNPLTKAELCLTPNAYT